MAKSLGLEVLPSYLKLDPLMPRDVRKQGRCICYTVRKSIMQCGYRSHTAQGKGCPTLMISGPWGILEVSMLVQDIGSQSIQKRERALRSGVLLRIWPYSATVDLSCFVPQIPGYLPMITYFHSYTCEVMMRLPHRT